MKILHTSDWHLGKTVHGQSLDVDQEHAVLAVERELSEGYKAILIAGDVFDRAVPPTSAVELLSGFLERVSSLGIEVIIIPGNHDSPERLDFISGIVRKQGLHLRCRYEQCLEPVLIGDGDEKVQVFTLPFVEEAVVKELFPEAGLTDHISAVNFLISKMKKASNRGVPSILVAHEYTGSDVVSSESERELLVGDQGRVPSALFSGFDYVALGHLHGPQTASIEGNAVYSGSILQYSFSESSHEKGAMSLIVEDGKIEVHKVKIRPLRRMTVLNDTLDNLLTFSGYEGFKDDYVCLSITGSGHHYEVQSKLRERFPHLLEIKMPDLTGGPTDRSAVRRALDSPRELFSLFLDRFGWDDPVKRARAMELFEEARGRTERSLREVA